MTFPRRAWLTAAVLGAACRAGGRPASAPGGGSPAGMARALPASAPPFVAGPLQIEGGYVRRRYARGAVAAEITVAARPQVGDEYEQWVAQSRGYPQAALALPDGAGNGFYTCSGAGTSGACDLHIQLRAGFHLEVMGGRRATRADLDQLMAGIRLGALLDAAPAP